MSDKTLDQVSVSKQKWVIIGLLITLVNPIFAGLIYGLALWREKGFKREGELIIFLSLVWGAISILFLMRYYGL
ncbi:MAG: hypothetical protein ACP5IX_03010 [Patescibacteria group bacterium]